MNRIDFLKKTAATATILCSGAINFSCDNKKSKKITILHTNDVHSHIFPFSSNDKKRANLGGIARRSTIINNIRKENPNTLLLDAGDIFQGTPYFNYFGGELEFKLMSLLKYDATTIGNHDFDNGIEGLHAQLPNAKFDFISSNYDFTNTIMDGSVNQFRIYEKNQIKIGVFGLGVELKGLVNSNAYKETKYLDPIEIAQDMSSLLKNDKKCDLIICLSHLGYKYNNPNKVSDIVLAKKTKNIDLIIGGHTHTLLDKPTEIKNIVNNNVIINQVGCFGTHLGRIDFHINTDTKYYSSQILSV